MKMLKVRQELKLATVLQPLRCFVIRNENDKLCLPFRSLFASAFSYVKHSVIYENIC